MPNFYVVATPIGNLGDISQRALEVLREVDFVLAEDTRVTRKLLNYFQIKTPFLSYYQHSKLTKVNFILELLKNDKDLALVCDAGTPGISDPGNKLVKEIIERLSNGVKVTPIPGPSALTVAASVSGFPMDRFLFLGFPPQKKKRTKFFEEVGNSKYPVIFYESPFRILKTLEELKTFLQTTNYLLQTKIVVGRELTKKFETIYRGSIEKVIQEIEKDKIKGEFTVIAWRLKNQ